MRTIKLLIFTIISLFSFISSAQTRGSMAIDYSCKIDSVVSQTHSNIATDYFSTKNNHNAEMAITFFIGCTFDKGEINISIDNNSINFNNGYLKNMITDDSASKNITFQLLYEENDINRTVDLRTESTFTKKVVEEKEELSNLKSYDSNVDFTFIINFVKTDDLPADPGKIRSDIVFNISSSNILNGTVTLD